MKKNIIPISFVGLVLLGLFLFLSNQAPGGDWAEVIQPSTRALLAGRNPYDEHRFLTPFWIFFVLIPPALLPPAMGSALFATMGAVGYLFTFYRLKARPVAVFFLVTTPAFLAALFNPNFDWLVALGFTLPPQIGLFLVLTKPQIGAPLVLFWLIEAWQEAGFRQVFKIFTPVIVAYAISFFIFGPWVLHMGGAVSSLSNTANVWPFGLLAGAVLLTVAMRRRKANLALISGPFFSPYLAPYSWLPAITGLLPGSPETIAACLALWGAFLVSNGMI